MKFMELFPSPYVEIIIYKSMLTLVVYNSNPI